MRFPMPRVSSDQRPAVPTEIHADHGHRNWHGRVGDPILFELPVKLQPGAPPRSSVRIWYYENGDLGIALYPWRPPKGDS